MSQKRIRDFLQEMVYKVDNNLLSKEELENLGVFYITTKEKELYEEKEALTNLFLGWYIRSLLEEEKEKNTSLQ